MGQSVTVPSSGSTRYMTSGSSQMIVCAGNVSMGQQPRMQQDQSMCDTHVHMHTHTHIHTHTHTVIAAFKTEWAVNLKILYL